MGRRMATAIRRVRGREVPGEAVGRALPDRRRVGRLRLQSPPGRPEEGEGHRLHDGVGTEPRLHSVPSALPRDAEVMREVTAGLLEFCLKARKATMSDPTRKMGLVQATMLVAGNMIGTGIFLLPVNLASVGGIAVFGWIIATAGAAALGLVFAKLGELEPKEGGPYAYARDFLGPYVGFQTNYVYWFGNWIGNIAIAVAAVGYLAELIPGISTPPASVFATAGVIWLFTFANIRGARVVGLLETWTMSLALIPILAISFLGWFWFNPAIFRESWNVSGGSERARHHAGRIDRALGLHGHRERVGVGRRDREPEAQHPAGHHDRARAGRGGLHAELHRHHGDHPERRAADGRTRRSRRRRGWRWGTSGMVVIAVCAVLKSFGSLGGWMLLVGQSAKAAADDGMFPAVFGAAQPPRGARPRTRDRRRADDRRAVRDHVARRSPASSAGSSTWR